jgi:hypothetical protein
MGQKGLDQIWNVLKKDKELFKGVTSALYLMQQDLLLVLKEKVICKYRLLE